MTRKSELSLCFFPQHCRVCGLCVEACRQKGSGLRVLHGLLPARTRLAVYQANDGPRLAVCRQCAEPPCVEICPCGALVKDETGRVVLDSKGCVGCQACVGVCPFGAIFFEDGVAYKCDLCTGSIVPACVIACPHDALLWEEAQEVARRRQRFRAQRMGLIPRMDR